MDDNTPGSSPGGSKDGLTGLLRGTKPGYSNTDLAGVPCKTYYGLLTSYSTLELIGDACFNSYNYFVSNNN